MRDYDFFSLEKAFKLLDNDPYQGWYPKHRNLNEETILELIAELKKANNWSPNFTGVKSKKRAIKRWAKQLEKLAVEYEANYKEMIKFHDAHNYQSDELVKRERELNKQDLSLRRKLGIVVGDSLDDRVSPYKNQEYNPWSC